VTGGRGCWHGVLIL